MSSSVRPSVCLSSVTFVHPSQAIEILCNVSMPCGTLAIHDLCIKILWISSQGNPFVGGLNPRGVVAKYSDFRPFKGYISETMQDASMQAFLADYIKVVEDTRILSAAEM